jgi:hypothetical protein
MLSEVSLPVWVKANFDPVIPVKVPLPAPGVVTPMVKVEGGAEAGPTIKTLRIG